MLVLRPTASLAKRMKVKLVERKEKSTTRLGDWYALDVIIGRKQYILCVSEHGRLPVLLEAAPYAEFPERLLQETAEILRAIGISETKISSEINEMKISVLAKTANRSILGSMNEYRFMLETTYKVGQFDSERPQELSLYLADMISLILPDGTPKWTALKIFSTRNSRPTPDANT